MIEKILIGIIVFDAGAFVGAILTSILAAGKRADEWLEKQMMEERK